jgi:hypothetical protein
MPRNRWLYAFVSICGVLNVIWITADWIMGKPASWPVWLFAIVFSIELALEYLVRALGEEA